MLQLNHEHTLFTYNVENDEKVQIYFTSINHQLTILIFWHFILVQKQI